MSFSDFYGNRSVVARLRDMLGMGVCRRLWFWLAERVRESTLWR